MTEQEALEAAHSAHEHGVHVMERAPLMNTNPCPQMSLKGHKACTAIALVVKNLKTIEQSSKLNKAAISSQPHTAPHIPLSQQP